MSDIKRVLVVGFGIGGATAATTLRRAGFEVHCVEIKPERSVAGTGICLLHNTLRALRSMDLADPCIESGLLFQMVRHFDHHGNSVGANPAPPAIGIRRPELARILESAAEAAGAEIERGITVEALENHGNVVNVTFTNGRQREYDLVVVADGAYSSTRALVFGPQYRPEFSGQSAWRYQAPRHAQIDGFCIYRAPGGDVVGALPTSRDTCYFFFLENTAAAPRLPDDQLHVLYRERLAAFDAPAIVESLELLTEPTQVLFRPFDIRLMPEPWHQGRVLLIGDAAHAPTPQLTSGGGMAIEDAVVLADCLAAPGSAAEALQAFSRRRYPRVKRIFETSLRICQIEQQAPQARTEDSVALLMDGYRFLGEPY